MVYIHHGILAIKKNGVTPLAAIWMDVEISMLSEVRERQISHSCMSSKTWYKVSNLIYKTEIDIQTQKTNFYGSQRGQRGGREKN